jgi:hypothetical protein
MSVNIKNNPDDERMLFADVGSFVSTYLIRMYARQVSDQHDTVWCPEWWRHPEAVSRLTALWRAYEFLRQDPATGMSNWWLNHADKHMVKLFDPQGPFKYCSARNGHKEMLAKLPINKAPEGLLADARDNPN